MLEDNRRTAEHWDHIKGQVLEILQSQDSLEDKAGKLTTLVFDERADMLKECYGDINFEEIDMFPEGKPRDWQGDE